MGPGPLARIALTCTRSDRCSAPVRGGRGAKCQLPHHHTGTHSSVVFECDGCGHTHRGTPHATSRTYDDCFTFCFLCARGLR